MKENLNIDELLNGFIDGELTKRHRTEVQRLISHDPQVAKRLRELQECKILISSLPRAEAPADMAERVKASLDAPVFLAEKPSGFDTRRGATYLLVRKVLAAAAMIGLVAVLGILVYSVLVPERPGDMPPIAGGQPPSPTTVGMEKPGPRVVAAEFYGRLELETDNFVAVDASVSRAIRDNGLSDCLRPTSPRDKGLYALSCSREALSLLLADLSSIWQKFDYATLFVETGQFAQQIVVNAVNAQQIGEIVKQDTLEKRTEVAANFALLNNMTELLPGRELFAAINGEGPDLMTVPKPRMAWDRDVPIKPALTENGRKVHLTIMIVGAK
jgi:hypothetical protein